MSRMTPTDRARAFIEERDALTDHYGNELVYCNESLVSDLAALDAEVT